MNWPHYDRTTWGLILAVAALVLMIPANILSNILTEKLRNWWATRSQSSLRSRIEMLESELAELEKRPAISEVEEQLLSFMPKVDMLLTETLMIFLAVVLIFERSTSSENAFLKIVVVLSAIILMNVSRFFMLRKSFLFLRERSPSVRREVRTSILKLKARLDSIR